MPCANSCNTTDNVQPANTDQNKGDIKRLSIRDSDHSPFCRLRLRKRLIPSRLNLPYDSGMIVLIDNYDSFTYNLVQKLGEVAPKMKIEVFRNDKVTVDQVEELKPSHIVISPGP